MIDIGPFKGRFKHDDLVAACYMPAKPMTALDAKVAAFAGDSVVTTPNEDYVPEVLTGTAQVQLRGDLRFGPDDATLWPQPYLEKYPFLPLIPKKPSDPENYKAIMWWLPRGREFRASEDLHVGGVGLIAGANFDKLDKEVHKLKDWTREIIDKPDKEEIPRFMGATYATMMHCWVRLAHSPGTFEEKCLEVSEVQRAWLEHWAVMDYHRGRQQMIETRTEPPPGPVKETVGCFTASIDVAQRCFVAGVPVWLIRDYRVLLGGTVRVDKRVEFSKVASCLELGKREGVDYPVVFSGRRDHEGRYTEQHRFMRSRLVWRNPWEDGEDAWKLGDTGLMSVTRSLKDLEAHPTRVVKSTSKRRDHPYAQRGRGTSKEGGQKAHGRDKFAEPEHNPLSPPGIPAWVEGLKNVKHLAPGDAGGKQKTKTVEKYLFPDPGLVRPKFYENWLRSRTAWVWRANQTDRPATLISPSLWRECLFYGLATGQSTLLPEKGKQFERVKKMAEAFMLELDSDGNLVVPRARKFPLAGKETRLMWRGRQVAKKEDGSLDDQVVREMLWELYELSFRLELRALDRGLSRADSLEDIDQREKMVNRCFPGGDTPHFELTPPVIPVSNAGLASDDIEERGPHIVALARLMTGWTVGKPKAIEDLAFARELSCDDLAKLESAVANLYCQSFYDYRERAPLTPHRIK